MVQGAKDVKTAAFPSAFREISDGSFADIKILSAVLDEASETRGDDDDQWWVRRRCVSSGGLRFEAAGPCARFARQGAARP